jgi:hypothetical protein
LLASALLLYAEPGRAVPSFARQTKLPCNACHTQFPELNSFGREFKLNGYVLRNIEGLESKNAKGRSNLDLPLIPMLSLMFETSLTQTQRAMNACTAPTCSSEADRLGRNQNGTIQFPQQISLFWGGELTNHIGAFGQVTYSQNSGTFGMDNTDIRFADHIEIDEVPVVYGLSLNNNPTVQDLWNSTPAWRFPYFSSAIAPTPAAAPIISGRLAQQVAGLSAYALWNDLVYVEAGAYRSAPQGITGPLGGQNASSLITNVAPYWRLALQKQIENQYFMLGTFGIRASLLPGAGFPNNPPAMPAGPQSISGPANTFTDVGIDFNYQLTLDRDSITVHGAWIHEYQNYSNAFVAAGGAEHGSDSLDSFQLAATYHLGTRWGFTIEPFVTFGTRDNCVYNGGTCVAGVPVLSPITGSRNGLPNNDGVTFEIDFNPWQNTRLALQYIYYYDFNGTRSNYDGFGRNASYNNTLYLFAWFAY